MRLSLIELCLLALATALRPGGALAVEDWQVQQLQADLQKAREEIAQLRAEQAEQRRMLQLLLDANPGVKANIVKKMEDDAAAAKKAEEDARAAAVNERLAATSILAISSDGFQILTYAGRVYEVTRNSGQVAKWPAGIQFALGVERYRRGADGQVYDALESTTPIPISAQGGDAVSVKFDPQATAVMAEIVRLNTMARAGEKIDEVRMAALLKDPKVKKLYAGKNAIQPDSPKPPDNAQKP